MIRKDCQYVVCHICGKKVAVRHDDETLWLHNKPKEKVLCSGSRMVPDKTERWLKERGTDPPTFCPYEKQPDGSVLVTVGMMMISDTPPRDEPCDGEFWYDENDNLQVRLNTAN